VAVCTHVQLLRSCWRKLHLIVILSTVSDCCDFFRVFGNPELIWGTYCSSLGYSRCKLFRKPKHRCWWERLRSRVQKRSGGAGTQTQ